VRSLKEAGRFALELGAPAVITHLGFLPEDSSDPSFDGILGAVRDIAEYLRGLGLEFWFETGQETPATLLGLMAAVGTGNLGVNLDPANLVVYGRGNPIDALEILGGSVKNVHAKDGRYPVEAGSLGAEVKVGEGDVRWPEFLRQLEIIGYAGPYIIEREIEGERQKRDIVDTIGYLESLLGERGSS
jgi:sugar phosphate isomerase/epimerase